ncbi:MAG: transcription elongation factor GreA [Clostridia bacterium]|nr:transcription elongation factor GreA [Clostridia bacterium]
MATESIILTKEGYKKLEEELEILVKEKRGEAAERVKQAREFGDLSENAEYDAAKEDQGRLEAKILEIEATLKYAKVIDDSELDLSVISVGCVVKMHDEDMDEVVEYKLVGAAEANYEEGSISNKSPLGQAILGKKVGDRAEVKAPNGIIYFYKILSISK